MDISFVGLSYDFIFFFFFKQKTAYEMRISDWSSDVCSSDLPCRPALSQAERRVFIRRHDRAGGVVHNFGHRGALFVVGPARTQNNIERGVELDRRLPIAGDAVGRLVESFVKSVGAGI